MKREAIIQRMVARFGRERWNEHVKLLATLLNGLAIAATVGVLVAPNIGASRPPPFSIFALALIAVLSHLASQLVMRYFRGRE